MDRTSRHPAKVRLRGAPGRIVQAPAQTSGALLNERLGRPLRGFAELLI
jgi:hypothetical protein